MLKPIKSLPKTVASEKRKKEYEKQEGRSLAQLKENYFTITNEQMVTSRSLTISKKRKFTKFQIF